MIALSDVLRSLEVSPSAIEKLAGNGKGSIFGFPIEGEARVYRIWRELRDQRMTTGFWPLVLGDEKDVLHLRQRLEFHSYEKTKAIIRRGQELNLKSWMEAASFEVLRDIFSFRPHPERYFAGGDQILLDLGSVPVYLGLIPTNKGWQSPAYTFFGNWSDCPPPEIHTRLFRRWNRIFSAEIFSVTRDEVGMIVNNPPSEKTVAHELRMEIFLFCPTRGRYLERDDGFFENVINKPFWHFKWSYPWNDDVYGHIDLDSLITNG